MSTEVDHSKESLERVIAVCGAYRGVLTRLVRESEEIKRDVPVPEESLDRLRTVAGLKAVFQ